MANGFSDIKTDIVPLAGGLDLVTTPVMVPPGRLISSNNFEPDINGGYKRIPGIERYDGHISPHDGDYYIADVVISGLIAIGDTITGATSGATAKVLLVIDSTHLLVNKVTGTFVSESFTISAVVQGTISDININAASTNALHAYYKSLTADDYRADISAVPGSGYVRGVKYFQGSVYAWRDNAGGTACVMYRATASGWSAITFGQEIQFVQRVSVVTMTIAAPGVVSWTAHGLANGHPIIFTTTGALPTGITAGTTYYVVNKAANTFQVTTAVGLGPITTSGSQSGVHTCTAGGIEVLEGSTITGNISGATGVVKRALLRTGTWSVAPVGTIVFDSVTGTFQSGEALQVSSDAYVQASTDNTAITLLPGGKMDFDIYNFSGSATTERLYFADGVNPLSEFDGTRLVPIRTGTTPDTPLFVKGHKNQLVCAINTDLIISGIGDPYSYTAITGSSDIAVGENITGIKPQVGDATSGALLVTTKNKVFILYGNDTTDFNLVTYAPNNGGRAYTLQNIGFAHFLDARGVTQMATSRNYGGFQMNVLTNLVQPYIDSKLGLEMASCVIKSSNQYRLFFSDGTGLTCQIVPDPSGTTAVGASMPFDYGDIVFNTIDAVIDTSGDERIFGAATNGYVYELNVGTSFDGDPIQSHIMLTFNNSKSARLRKRYRRSIIQLRSGSSASISVGYDLSYGDGDASYGVSVEKTLYGSGGFWDSFTWDRFTWDSAYANQVTINTVGTGENISLVLTNDSDQDDAFTVHTCFLHYTQGRLNR